jgi:peptide/nickel transport system permease protein
MSELKIFARTGLFALLYFMIFVIPTYVITSIWVSLRTDLNMVLPVIAFGLLIPVVLTGLRALAASLKWHKSSPERVAMILIPIAGIIGAYYYWNSLLCYTIAELSFSYWSTLLMSIVLIVYNYLQIPAPSVDVASSFITSSNVSRLDLDNHLQKPRTLWGDAWRQFRKHKLAMLAGIVLLSIVLMVVVGPFVYTVDPENIDFSFKYSPMTCERPFGADDLGRDLFARIIQGGRVSLLIGITAMALSMTLGTMIGLLAGYFRPLDNILMRITDIFLSLPTLPLLLVITLLFREPIIALINNIMSIIPAEARRNLLAPAEIGIFIMTVSIIGLLGWMPTARLVRGEVLTVKEREFVLAARSIGATHRNIIFRHIMPNVLSPVIVSATFSVAGAIITESALSFLGLGFPPDFPTWGRILFDGQGHVNKSVLLVLWPGLMISLTVLCVNFIGDGLRDALDPRLRK